MTRETDEGAAPWEGQDVRSAMGKTTGHQGWNDPCSATFTQYKLG